MDPSDIPLPAILDPLLDYLQDNLPWPVYSVIISTLSNSLALFTAVANLLLSLLHTNPLNWNAQTVFPPLLALLTAYLALVSLYRTTTWMFRTSLWFVKWGTIVGGLIAVLAWLSGGTNVDALSILTGLVDGEPHTTATRRKPQSRKQRPKAWESFAGHQAWQYQENKPAKNEAEISQFLKSIVEKNAWWQLASSFMGERETEAEQKGKTKSR